MSTDRQSLACDFTAIPEDERQEHAEVAATLFESIMDCEPTEGGYTFNLPSETQVIEQAGTFIARERLCCPFFNFELNVSHDQESVRLRLSGGRDVKQYIENTVLEEWDC